TREISADGKSSARINGRTATAAMLREVGSLLVDIHGQHENRILMSNDNQRDILDNYGAIGGVMEDYREKFREFSRVSRRLKALREENENRVFQTERLTAIIEELEGLNLSKGEGERLESELERCRSSARIRAALYNAYGCLNAEENPAAIDLLREARKALESVSDAEPAAGELAERLDEIIPEAEDIAAEIIALVRDDDEYRQEELADRVSALKHAKRRYNMESDELVDYLEQCRGELAELGGMEDEIEELSERKHVLAEEVKSRADNITVLRTAAAEKLSAEICGELSFLAMPQVKIVFAVKPDKVTINGRDTVEMLISANAGEELKPLNKIASGGELSRIMLAIKSVLAENDDIPTLIFDEVD
ncbi:MAG: DNA repair protein RecN, partial [Oscillospiraceae bacterium]|nr:DNA repair protein RecN [Oscillospiraceae bacterium]